MSARAHATCRRHLHPACRPTIVMAACAGEGNGDDAGSINAGSINVRGSLTLKDFGGTTCDKTKPGFEDVAAGAEVTVRDEQNSTIAVGRLGPGILHKTGTTVILGAGTAVLSDCAMPFTLTVPKAKFYTFEVGERGRRTFTADELRDSAQSLDLGSIDIGNR